jgi:hypothetical protein
VAWFKFSGPEMTAKDLSNVNNAMPNISLPAEKEQAIAAPLPVIGVPDDGRAVPRYSADMAIPAPPIVGVMEAKEEIPSTPANMVGVDSSTATNVVPLGGTDEVVLYASASPTVSPVAGSAESTKGSSALMKDFPPVVDMASSEEVAALKTKVASLENKIADLERKIADMANAKPAAAAAAKPAAKPQPVTPRATVTPTPVKAVSSAPPQRIEVPQKAQTPQLRAPVMGQSAAQSRVINSYVIRAARPGQAWIATSAASSDLREVRIGDTVPGLGRIQSIFLDNHGWAIVGTQATLR